MSILTVFNATSLGRQKVFWSEFIEKVFRTSVEPVDVSPSGELGVCVSSWATTACKLQLI